MKLKFTRKTWYFFLLAAAAVSMLGGFAVLGGMDFSALELVAFCLTGIAALFLAAQKGAPAAEKRNYTLVFVLLMLSKLGASGWAGDICSALVWPALLATEYERGRPIQRQLQLVSAAEVLHIFEDTYLNRAKPLNVVEAHFAQVNGIIATVTLELNGQRKVVTSVGNGRLDAVANAIQSATGMDFHLETYSEHSLDEGSTSRAASYVGLEWGDGIVTWGAGTDTDIIVAGIHALVSAINNK